MPVERVGDPRDPRLADYLELREGELVKRRGVFIAEGSLVVRALLSSRFRTRSLLVLEKHVEALSPPPEVPVYVAPREVMDAVAGFPIHRGVLAAGERGDGAAVSSVLGGEGAVVVLQGVSNHDNVGGIFRNAAALGASSVLLDETCADPLYRKSLRVSMGTALSVPFARAPMGALLDALEARGYETIALTPAPDAVSLRDLHGVARPALLLGAEGPGLSAEVLARARRRVRIPIVPGVDSLNVATASAIALYALAGAP